MKIGTENRAKLGLMIGLCLVAIVSVWHWMRSSDPSPAAGTSQAAAANASAPRPGASPRRLTKPRQGSNKTPAVPASLDPTLRFDLLRSSENREYTGGRRNIFAAEIVIPTPLPPSITPNPHPVSQPLPGPPPINLKFYGFANKPGETRQVFLSSGDDIFVGREGEIVDRRYRIVHIGAGSVDIEDVLNNNRQTIPLTQG